MIRSVLTGKLGTATPATSKDLSDEEYAAKVTELYNKIQTTSAGFMEGVDQTDMNQVVKVTKAMIVAVKPYYDELATLTTSGKYKEAQVQIATGATASSKMLELSMELLILGEDSANSDNADILKKAEELQAQADKFAVDAQLLITGLTTVIGEIE